MKILRIPSRGEPYAADIKNSLAAMQNEVGGYIEVVPISNKHRLVVNEEGKLGPFPINVNATKLFRAAIGTLDFIMGDAFVTCFDGGEDFTDMTSDAIEALIEEMKG